MICVQYINTDSSISQRQNASIICFIDRLCFTFKIYGLLRLSGELKSLAQFSLLTKNHTLQTSEYAPQLQRTNGEIVQPNKDNQM